MAEHKTEFSISTNALVKITLMGLLLFFLWTIRDLLILILSAVVLASALEPLVAELHHKKIPRLVSVLAVYLVATLIIVFIGYLVLPPVGMEFKQLAGNAGEFSAAFQQKLAQAGIAPRSDLADAITTGFQTFASQLGGGNFFQTTIGVFNGALDIVTVLVISFYLVAEQNSMKAAIVSLIPEEYQQKTIHSVNRIQRKIGSWLIGQFIISAVVFMMSLIVLTLLHVQFALVLAILAGVFELVPYIGPWISAVPAVFFAYVQNPALAIAVGILYLIISKTEGYILVPTVMKRTTGVSPLVILVAILVGLRLAGIYGVFLAVPVVAGINAYYQGSKPETA